MDSTYAREVLASSSHGEKRKRTGAKIEYLNAIPNRSRSFPNLLICIFFRRCHPHHSKYILYSLLSSILPFSFSPSLSRLPSALPSSFSSLSSSSFSSVLPPPPSSFSPPLFAASFPAYCSPLPFSRFWLYRGRLDMDKDWSCNSSYQDIRKNLGKDVLG